MLLSILATIVLFLPAISLSAEHKRIFYEKTLYRYTSESKTLLQRNYAKTGNCVDREIEKGTLHLCLNLNNTYSRNPDDVWVVKDADHISIHGAI